MAIPKIVQLAITDQCNLSCIYCYEKEKNQNRVMSPNVAFEIIERHLSHPSETPIQFDFTGAEPLTCFDLMQLIVEFAHSRRWPRQFEFDFSTNGTLIDDAIASWLDEHNCVRCHLSLDGTQEAHDKNRSNSYNRAIRYVPWLLDRDRRLSLTSSVKMTISPETVCQLFAGVDHLHKLGFMQVNANVPYEPLWLAKDLSVALEAFAQELDKLVYFYYKNPNYEPPHLVNLPINRIIDEVEESVARWCGAGTNMVCYDHAGVAYPCHRFTNIATGNMKKYVGSSKFEASLHKLEDAEQQCVRCPFLPACPSCLAFNWETNRDVDERTVFHCPFIILQLKATAKLTALRMDNKLSKSSNPSSLKSSSEDRRLLQIAMQVIELLERAG